MVQFLLSLGLWTPSESVLTWWFCKSAWKQILGLSLESPAWRSKEKRKKEKKEGPNEWMLLWPHQGTLIDFDLNILEASHSGFLRAPASGL